jgi:hypothetical protein
MDGGSRVQHTSRVNCCCANCCWFSAPPLPEKVTWERGPTMMASGRNVGVTPGRGDGGTVLCMHFKRRVRLQWCRGQRNVCAVAVGYVPNCTGFPSSRCCCRKYKCLVLSAFVLAQHRCRGQRGSARSVNHVPRHLCCTGFLLPRCP